MKQGRDTNRQSLPDASRLCYSYHTLGSLPLIPITGIPVYLLDHIALYNLL